MVLPHLSTPSGALISSAMSWKKAVLSVSYSPTRATLSPLLRLKFRFLQIMPSPPSMVAFLTSSTILPGSRSILKFTHGNLRLEAGISSTVILSKSFLRLVACFALAAFDAKRRMNALSSSIFSSARRFWSLRCFWASWLAAYQNS